MRKNKYPPKKLRQPLASHRSDGWVNPLTGQGIGGQDKAVSGFYSTCLNGFSWPELDSLYRSDGIARRIIDVVAAEMVRQGWEIEGDEGDLASEVINKINGPCMLTDLIKWSRLYGGAILVMGIIDGRPLDEPVDTSNIQQVRWLRLYDRFQAIVNSGYMIQDLNSDFYGHPEFYDVTDYMTAQTFRVHHSRVLRMDWAQVPARERNVNMGWGDSVLQSVYDQLRNYGATFGNVATIMQDFVNGILKVPDLSESLANNQCSASDVISRVNSAMLTKSNTGVLVLDGDETFEKLTTNVSGISDILDRFMLSLSSVTGIPFSLLFGKSPAGLNATGESDIRNFYDLVKQYQEAKLKPVLEKLIRYIMLSADGPYEGVIPEKWSIQFTPLWQNSEEQEANVRRTVAETDRIYIELGVLDPEEVKESRFGGSQWSMTTVIKKDTDPSYSYLEEQKEEVISQEPGVTIGPDTLPQSGNNILVVR